MKKRILALVLSVALLMSTVPGTIATSAASDSSTTQVVLDNTSPTETNPSDVIVCENCGAEGHTDEDCEACTECKQVGTHAEGCTLTPLTDGTEPQPCTTCGVTGCTSTHENWCAECQKDDCGVDHTTEPTTPSNTVSGNDADTEPTTEPATQPTTEPTMTNCEYCGVALTEDAVHTDDCLTNCTCEPVEGVHQGDCVFAPEVKTCEHCGVELTEETEHTEDCPLYVAPLIDQLLAVQDLNALYDLVFVQDNAAVAYAAADLAYDELEEVVAHIEALYAAEEDPDDILTERYEMLVEVMTSYMECPDCGEAGGEHTEDCPRWQAEILALTSGNTAISQNMAINSSITLTGNATWTLSNNAVVTINAPITIPDGKTLTINGAGTFIRDVNYPGVLISPSNGGTLIIEGNSDTDRIIIDGNNVIANRPAIHAGSATVTMKYATVQNNKNRSVNDSGKPNASGGGIQINRDGSLTMDYCTVTKNTASVNGGGIFCQGSLNISNSVISYNVAGSTEFDGENVEGKKVNVGRGGGIYLNGAGANASTVEGTLSNVQVLNNAAVYYGGGVQVDNYGKLTINNNTAINNNIAILHGAAGVHVTSFATFIMDDGEISGNSAQTVGGAIHSSHGCTLQLNKGTISNNTANGRGAGVHLNTGCSITLNEGITISGNKVYNRPTGTHVTLDATGDNWSNVRYEGPCVNNGYGGGVMIDSGTCTVNGATVTGNYAEVGGGGIALVMLNITSEAALRDIEVVNFTMISGEIIGNTTAGNGAGVYMMSNKIKEGLLTYWGEEGSDRYNEGYGYLEKYNKTDYINKIPVATVLGGTINNNVATNNGGGLYLDENTEFHISGTGDISSNKAVDGAGVYIAKGTAYVEGGEIKSNAAQNAGGGIYVSGSVNMTGGSIDNNYAVNGGGAYITGGNFSMISGSLSNNTVKSDDQAAAEARTEGYGGGVFVHGGNITIGVKDCDGTGTNHTTGDHTDKPHPQVLNNAAVFGGGLAADGGTINIYCGTIKTNNAMNNGAGTNIFMYDSNAEDEEEPVLNHLGGTVGETTNHGMVVIGGELTVPIEGNIITINYHGNDEEQSLEIWISEAPESYYLNLPYCPMDWEATQNELANPLTFVGWTYDMDGDQTVDPSVSLEFIRDKNDYKALGDPVEIRKEDWKKFESGGYYIDFYAVWAPMTNQVSYAVDLKNYGSATDELDKAMTSEQQGNNTASYAFSQSGQTITMTNPEIPGYTFLGWRLTPSTATISNWCTKCETGHAGAMENEAVEYLLSGNTSGTATLAGYSYAYSGNTFTITTDRNFGDIKLTALFEEETVDYTYTLVGPDGATNFGQIVAEDASEDYKNVTANKTYTVTIGKVTGDPGKATATAEYGFKLKDPNGWFTDETGTTAVNSTWVKDGVLTPVKVNDLYEGGTFYAVIEYHLADLIISKTATGSYIDNKDHQQTFIFEVYQGDKLLTTVALQPGESVTIKDLTIGTTYTVKEVGGWSWRFDSKTKTHTMIPNEVGKTDTNTVSFVNEQNKFLWLSDDAFVLNQRKKN